MFINGLFYAILSLSLVIFGVFIGDNKSTKEFNKRYNEGYDRAVEDMKEYGYYFDKDRKRHTGEWIEKEEENV